MINELLLPHSMLTTACEGDECISVVAGWIGYFIDTMSGGVRVAGQRICVTKRACVRMRFFTSYLIAEPNGRKGGWVLDGD